MASLVLGAVGAAIGNTIGGTFLGMSAASIGWSVGSTLGSLLFQEKPPTQYGPRLSDLKVQTSTYGNDIPRVYGTMRLAGNMIWSKPILETKHKQKSGGKGGQKATVVTYTYYQTFAVALCAGPIVGVRKIWANGELIYNIGDTAGVYTIISSNLQAKGYTFYTGTETQEANSLIQADVGAADCPAYRGIAYVVFNNLQLAKYGNRTPNLEFEVVGQGTEAWISLISDPNAFSSSTSLCTVYENGLIYWGYISGSNYVEKTYTLEGSLVSTVTYPYSTSQTPICNNWRGLLMKESYPYKWINAIEGVEVGINALPWWPGGGGIASVFRLGDYFIRAEKSGNDLKMIRFPIPSGDPTPAPDHDLYATIYTYSASLYYTLGIYPDESEMCFYHFAHQSTVGATDGRLVKFNANGSVLDWWDITSAAFGAVSASYKIENGVFYNFAGARNAVRLNDDHTSTLLMTHPSVTALNGNIAFGTPGIFWASRSMYKLGHQVGASDVAVSAIIEDECALAGLSAADIDVTDIAATVPGYSINRRGTVRGGLEPLMRAFYFDAVEADEKINYVTRGGSIAATFAEDDLAAHNWGEAMPDAALLERTQDVELPDEITITYMDKDAAYQVGTQYARRLIGSSRVQTTVPMAMALSSTKARHIADVLIYDAWQGRAAFNFTTSNKYSYIVPTDVVYLYKDGRAYTARIITRDEQGGILTFGAVWEDLQVYTQDSPAPSLPAPSEEVGLLANTKLLLLDVPLLRDVDDGYGFYAAACGYTAGWPGTQIFKSADGGATWTEYGEAMLNEAAIGVSTTALGSFTQNLFDETNTVTVTLQAGTLASVTEAEVLNGANAAILGSEIIQFRTATLTGTMTWQLSGLLRGRRGTEWARSTHVSAERFALLDESTTYLQDAASSDVGLARKYRGVTFGAYLDDAEELNFTYSGVAGLPFAPVLLGGGRDASGNITLNWVRRGRIGSEWVDSIDVPVGEASESYEVEIWDGSGYATLKRTISGLSAQTTSYTAAQQVTDFGGNQSTIYVRVYQLSATFGRGYKLEGTV